MSSFRAVWLFAQIMECLLPVICSSIGSPESIELVKFQISVVKLC